MVIEGTTYGLADERRCRLVVVHAGRWVFWRKERMLTVWVIVIVRTQLGNFLRDQRWVVERRKKYKL